MVFHPFFLSDFKIRGGVTETQSWIMASIYTKDNFEFGLKKSKFNPITINSQNIFEAENWIQLHIHQADENTPEIMAISPNNAGVLLDLSCPIITFYSLAIAYEEKTKEIDLLITNHTILNEAGLPNRILYKSLSYYEFLQGVQIDKLVKPKKSTWQILESNKMKKYEDVQKQLISSLVLNNITCSEEIENYINKKALITSRVIKEMGCQTFEDVKEYIEMWIWDVFTNEIR